MLQLRKRIKERVDPPVAPELLSCGLWTTAFTGLCARLTGLIHSLRLQRGFSLIESIAAVGVIGISVVGSVILLNATVRTSSETAGDLGLIQIVRAQVETIQQSPFMEEPTQYPLADNIPPNVTVTFTATDPGTSYTFPAPSGATLTQVVQKIEVTAKEDDGESTMTFYKVSSP